MKNDLWVGASQVRALEKNLLVNTGSWIDREPNLIPCSSVHANTNNTDDFKKVLSIAGTHAIRE